MKVWITKYALSSGIEHIDVLQSESHPDMVTDVLHRHRSFHEEGRDWHRTEAAAIAEAEKMRVAKIASLKKQIAKLEKLSFKPTTKEAV